MKNIKIYFIIIFIVFACLLAERLYSQEKTTEKEHYAKGVEYGMAGNFKNAKECFKKALKIEPLDEDIENALEATQDILSEKIKEETAVCLFRALNYDGNKMYDEALAEFIKALKSDPNYAKTYNILGTRYLNSNMLKEAKRCFEKALEIDPDYAKAHNNLGLVYYYQNKPDEALEECKKAIKINPNYAGARAALGKIYLRGGLYDEAIKECKLEPQTGEAVYVLDLAYFKKAVKYGTKGEFDKAEENFKLAEKVYPVSIEYQGHIQLCRDAVNKKINAKSAVSFFNSIYYNDNSEYDKAIAECGKALKTNPNYAFGYFLMGEHYLGKKDKQKEIYCIKKASDLDPENSEYHLKLAIIYWHEKLYDSAIAECEKNIKLPSPMHGYAYFILAHSYFYGKKEYKTAEIYLNKAIKLDVSIDFLAPSFLKDIENYKKSGGL